MKRATKNCFLLFSLCFWSVVAYPQTQHQIDIGHLPNAAQIEGAGGSAMQYDLGKTNAMSLRTPGRYRMQVAPDTWMQQQAQSLQYLLTCYLDDQSLNNELTAESKAGDDPQHLVEVRISLLKTLIKNNVAAHCK